MPGKQIVLHVQIQNAIQNDKKKNVVVVVLHTFFFILKAKLYIEYTINGLKQVPVFSGGVEEECAKKKCVSFTICWCFSLSLSPSLPRM